MRPCTVSDRLCILPNVVTAQRPERPQTNKSEATLWRGSSGEQFRIHARNPPPNFRGVSPPEGAGGGNEPKAQQPFEFQVRSVVPVAKCFPRALDCSERWCRIIASDGQKSASRSTTMMPIAPGAIVDADTPLKRGHTQYSPLL